MKRLVFALAGVAAVVGGLIFWQARKIVYNSATAFSGDCKELILPETTPLEQLKELLYADSIIQAPEAFVQVAGLKKFENAKPGRYLIAQGSSHNTLINRFRSGDQDPVRLSFNATRTAQELAGRVAQQIQADSARIVSLMTDPDVAAKFGFNSENFRTMFIPNTYEVWWTTDANGFIARMAEEYKRFWNDERKAKAESRKLSQSEVIALASIVSAETAKRDEAPVVAGLYLNRLRIGMPLQADPTLIYAHQDFTIRRVLDWHKEIDSPYNTYNNLGLPPGPINFPDPNCIDAVLNPAEHDYLYMCAKSDLSGYHHFAKTLNQHLVYAREYHHAISRQR